MNTIDRDYRLDDIVKIIREREFITMTELAEMTGKTTRTMRTDIKRIKEEYPNIVTRRGKYGGVEWGGIKE